MLVALQPWTVVVVPGVCLDKIMYMYTEEAELLVGRSREIRQTWTFILYYSKVQVPSSHTLDTSSRT